MGNNKLHEFVNAAVDGLSGDLKTVLILLYGLGDSGKQSIREISRQLNVKTSRVARMEMKAIRNLRRPALCAPFLEVLDEMDPFIWHEISEEISEAGSLIRKSESYDRFMEAFPGEISLAIKCRYGGLLRWIECNAFISENAWFRSKYPPETVKDKVRQLVGIWNNNESPFMVSHLTGELQVDVDFLGFILALSPWATGFYGGYAAERPITSPVLRAIRLHRLFLYQYADTSVALDRPVKDYNISYHDDQLTERLAETITRSRPHLFLEKSRQAWSASGSVEEHAPYAEVDDVAPGNNAVHADANRKMPSFVYERPWAEATASGIVEGILEQKDFSRRKTILKAFLERSEGRYERVSAEATLAINDNILEAAPAVYGLRGTCNGIDPVNTWSETLLTRKACKSFILDRYAGEPLNVYPLWTPAMEQQWCIWAGNNSELKLGMGYGGESDRAFNRKLFQSLLFVSEPELWPVSDSVKSQWLFKKQALSTYHFTKPVPRPLWQRDMSLQDLFSVAVTSKQIGYANWARTSHALGLGHHGLQAAGALVLLIALEMILPTDNWQRRHELGPQMDATLLLMVKEIREKGFLHWMDETGAYIKSRLREGMSRVQLGWVSADWILEFIDALEGRKPPEQVAESPSQAITEASARDASESKNHMEAPEQLMLPF